VILRIKYTDGRSRVTAHEEREQHGGRREIRSRGRENFVNERYLTVFYSFILAGVDI